MAAQWVQLGQEVLFATERAAWIRPAALTPAAFVTPMPPSAPSSRASTRALLDGAIAAAERAARPRSAPPMSGHRWAWHLLAQWHSAHRSLALLAEAVERFRHAGRDDLAAYARHKLAEEEGHDQLPLDDLRALGYDADALVDSLAPDPAITEGLRYAETALDGAHPTEFLGYVYAIERRVIRIPRDWFVALERVLPPGVDAASSLRAHATDLDHGHVAEAIDFFAGLPGPDRTSLAVGCHRITQIRCAGMCGPQPQDHQLRTWLAPFVVEGTTYSTR